MLHLRSGAGAGFSSTGLTFLAFFGTVAMNRFCVEARAKEKGKRERGGDRERERANVIA
jgi:hypothetical protein